MNIFYPKGHNITNINNNKIYMPNNFDSIKDDTNINDINFLRNQNHQNILSLYTKYYQDALTENANNIDINFKDKIKIVIYAPPISDICGGAMVLYNLIQTLNKLCNNNIIALLYCYDHKKHNNDFCNNFFNPFWMDDKTVVIYPETITGNPLNAKYVVRWILLDLGLEVSPQHYKKWDKKDLVYHWEPSLLNNTKQLVNIWVNPMIKNYNIKIKTNNCYAFKKMQWIPNTLNLQRIKNYHNENDINIDKLSIPEAIDTFNKSKLFYCYDPNTFFSIMAPLCGCVTVLHPVDNLTKEEYFKSRILCHKDGFCYDAGIAYGNCSTEINAALNSVFEAQDQFDYLRSLYHSTVNDFVKDIVSMVSDQKQLINTVENIYYNQKS